MRRLECPNGDFLDVPWDGYDRWAWGDDPEATDALVLQGEVLAEDGGVAVLSFGGLLCRTTPPHEVRVGDACAVTVWRQSPPRVPRRSTRKK